MRCKECDEHLNDRERIFHMCVNCLRKEILERDKITQMEIDRFNKRYGTNATYEKLTGDDDCICPFDLREFPLMKQFYCWSNIGIVK